MIRSTAGAPFIPGRFVTHLRQATEIVGAPFDEAGVRAVLREHDVPLRSGVVMLRAGATLEFGFRAVAWDDPVVGRDFDSAGRPTATWTRDDFAPWPPSERTEAWLHKHGILNGQCDDIVLSQAASSVLRPDGIVALDVPYLAGNPLVRRPALPWRLMRFRDDAPVVTDRPLFNVIWSFAGAMALEKCYSGDAWRFFAVEMGLDLSHAGD